MNDRKPPVDSILAIQNEIKRLNSPFKQYLDEQQRIRGAILGRSDSIRDSFSQILVQEKERRRQLEALLSPPIRRAAEAVRALNPSINDVRTFIEQWRDRSAAPGSAAIIRESARNALDLSARYREAAQQLWDDDAVRNAVFKLNESARYVRDLLATLSVEELQRSPNASMDWVAAEEQIERVQDVLAQAPARFIADSESSAIKFTPYEWITMWIAIAGILVALTQVFLQIQADRNSGQDSVEERAFRKSLLSALESLQDQAPQELALYAVGSRGTHVKSAIHGGIRIGKVHPNQVVVVTGKQGRWVKVRFRDHIEERDIEGWILKHYILRVETSFADKTSAMEQEW